MVYENNINELFKLVKHIMIDEEISQQELSNRLSKSKQATSNIFKQSNISINTLQDICNAMDCQLVIDIVPNDK